MTSSTRKQTGISLIEAMISLLIVSFGMLGLVGMHLALNGNADVSKQRSEAVRLAQADMENLRVYRTTGVASTDTRLWTNLIVNASNSTLTTGTSTNAYSSNTAYTLTRSVVTSPGSDYKEIQVQVAWQDRKGANQSVVLRSIVSNIDPAIAMSLSIAPNGSPVKDTLGRDVQVPIPAKNLGDGTSVFKPTSSSTTAYIFSNDTGLITKTCTVSSSQQNAGITASDLACNPTSAYLLSGFIRYEMGNINNTYDPLTANAAVPSGTTWNVELVMNDVEPDDGKQGLFALLTSTSTAWSSGISNSRYSSGVGLPSCSSEPLKTVSFTAAVNYSQTNNGSTTTVTSTTVFVTVPYSLVITGTSAAANLAPYTAYASTAITNIVDLNEYYVGYSCVIYPIDLDNDQVTPTAWTGRATLTVSGGSIAANSTAYKVCRFSADYNLNGYVWSPNTVPATSSGSVSIIDNQEHPYAYLNVQRSLSNQNYLVIKGNENCPNGSRVEVNGTGSETYTDTQTVQHQP